jgi:hypothetical protein
MGTFDYMPLYYSFIDSSDYKLLKRKTGSHGIDCLLHLFIYASRHRQDGILRGKTDEQISVQCDWDPRMIPKYVELDKRKSFVTLLEEAGILCRWKNLEAEYLDENYDDEDIKVPSGNTLVIVNWFKYNDHFRPENVRMRRERAAKGGYAKKRGVKKPRVKV